MSLILDALRKIEEERRTRRPGNSDVRSDVLSYRPNHPPPGKSRTMLILAAALLLLGTLAIPVLWQRTASSHGAGQGGDQLAGHAQVTESVTAALPPLPATPSNESGAAPPQRTAIAPEQKGTPAKQAHPVPQAAGEDQAAAGGDGNLVVSGIAWQEERALRRVVVNGSLLGEGGEIAGARVVEIRENRVRFSRGGKIFEISYAGGMK